MLLNEVDGKLWEALIHFDFDLLELSLEIGGVLVPAA